MGRDLRVYKQPHTLWRPCSSQVTCSGKHHQDWWCCQWQGPHWPRQEWWCFWDHGVLWPLWQTGRTRSSAVTFSARKITVYWLNCLAILLTKGPRFGFGFYRCLYLQGCFATCGTITETPSNSSLLFDLKGWTHYLDMGSNQHVQVTSCQKGLSLFKSPQNPQVTALYDCTAGRCCLYRAMVRCYLSLW